MSTVLDDYLQSAGAAHTIRKRGVVATAADRIAMVRRGLNRISLRLLKLGLWLRRAGLPAEALLVLRLSRWAWRTASGRRVVAPGQRPRQPSVHRERGHG